MEQIAEDRELTTPRRPPLLRSQMSEPAGSFDEFGDPYHPHFRSPLQKSFTGHEHYSVSYQSRESHPFFGSLLLSPSTQEKSYVDSPTSPIVFKGTMKSSCVSTSSWPQTSNDFVSVCVTPGRRRSSGTLISSRDQLSTSQCSAFYTSTRSPASYIGLALSAISSNASNATPSSCISPAACISSQTPSQNTNANKHHLKAILIVDSKSTEILIANDNVKRVFDISHQSLIGRRLTEVFSSNADGKPPAILHNELLSPDGKLKSVYGRAVDIIDSRGERGTVCVWSYPLTHAAAAASKGSFSERKHSMLTRTPSAVLPPSRRYVDISHGSPLGGSAARCGNQCVPLAQPAVAQEVPIITASPLYGLRSIPIQNSTPTTPQQNGLLGRCLRADKVRSELNKMVEGCASPLKETVVNGFHAQRQDNESDEKDAGNENVDEKKSIPLHERGVHITDGAAARRWLILMEPINALSIACTLGAKGRIFRVDDSLATLLGYVSMRELLGTEIVKLLPAVNLDCDDEEQHVCALGVRGNSIPVTVRIEAERDPSTKRALMYELRIRALSAVNGVITLTNTGALHSFNENFIEALVGKERKEKALNSEINITDIIPEFHAHIHKCPEMSIERAAGDDLPIDIEEEQSCHSEATGSHEIPDNQTSTKNTSLSAASSTSQIESGVASICLLETIDSASSQHSSSCDDGICSNHPSTSPVKETASSDTSETSKVAGGCEYCEGGSGDQCRVIREGTFYGLARHSDSNMIAVRFDVRRLEPGYPANWAVCIGYDRTADFGLFDNSENIRKESDANESVTGSADDDFAKTEVTIKRSDSATLPVVSIQALEDENGEAVCGEYSQRYDTFQLIGNGAFGSVKLAARKDTGLLAVAKFICKAKVLPESWVPSPKRGNLMVPIELHLLETLSHPNIVKVLDVFENDTYYQLVMEKLGCGMDLFEFIDHQPKLDEPLTSYIFRQILSAVAYLHSNNIVHRDVKDENVIIDQNFCCKLIDFGSAAYFGRDVVFSTFCGTMEYCSPEVLSGNKYRGPELEMWSLGILLYTLVYFENPFRSPQETVQAEIELPWDVSDGLFQVIAWLLQRDPNLRATVDDLKNHWWVKQPVDLRKYKFQDMLKSCDRAQIDPPLYVSELANHLKNASSCSALVIDVPSSHQEAGTVSAR